MNPPKTTFRALLSIATGCYAARVELDAQNKLKLCDGCSNEEIEALQNYLLGETPEERKESKERFREHLEQTYYPDGPKHTHVVPEEKTVDFANMISAGFNARTIHARATAQRLLTNHPELLPLAKAWVEKATELGRTLKAWNYDTSANLGRYPEMVHSLDEGRLGRQVSVLNAFTDQLEARLPKSFDLAKATGKEEIQEIKPDQPYKPMRTKGVEVSEFLDGTGLFELIRKIR